MEFSCISGVLKVRNLAHALEVIKKFQSRDTITQALNVENIASLEQLKFAGMESFEAFSEKRNFASNIAMEYLIRLSGSKDVSSIVKPYGLKEGKQEAVVLACGANASEVAENLVVELELDRDDSVLKPTEARFKALKTHYNLGEAAIKSISENESFEARFKALNSLVMERISLVGLEE